MARIKKYTSVCEEVKKTGPFGRAGKILTLEEQSAVLQKVKHTVPLWLGNCTSSSDLGKGQRVSTGNPHVQMSTTW